MADVAVHNWAIVAIPDKEDIVWKISSETVPHMTLLNLGDQLPNAQSAKILSYLEHAVETMLHRFRMAVDHRGVLGPQNADVLFFEHHHCEKRVKEFRDALLKNPDILELFNDSDQFPEWIPHLTLGFPETPAHPDTRDYTEIYSVGFNKIALWIDASDGPEIELKSRDAADLWAEHSNTIRELSGVSLDRKVSEEDALQFGRLGMKWGVVHPRGAGGLVKIGGRSTRAARRDAKKAGLHKLTNEELKTLTDRINLENNYRNAVSSSSRTAAFNVKAKRALDLGKNANDAIKFAASPLGQVILNQIHPDLAAKASKAASLGKAVDGGKKGKKNDLKRIADGLTPAVTGKPTGSKHSETAAERRVRIANSMRGR